MGFQPALQSSSGWAHRFGCPKDSKLGDPDCGGGLPVCPHNHHCTVDPHCGAGFQPALQWPSGASGLRGCDGAMGQSRDGRCDVPCVPCDLCGSTNEGARASTIVEPQARNAPSKATPTFNWDAFVCDAFVSSRLRGCDGAMESASICVICGQTCDGAIRLRPRLRRDKWNLCDPWAAAMMRWIICVNLRRSA